MVNKSAVKAVFTGSLKLGADESCLIVTDTLKAPIARCFYEGALKFTDRTEIRVIEPTLEHGAEPPADIADLMLKYDVELLITERSLTHTRARREASATGARIATMPMITDSIANRCLEIDYGMLKKESGRLHAVLRNARQVRVSAPAGTDMLFTVGEGGFFGQNGGSFDRPGAYGNLPEGEVSFAPADCDGVYVVDASFPGLGLLEEPLSFKVEKGRVMAISGEKAEQVRRRLDSVGSAAYRVAELGIGLNPRAMVTGNILEDEKVRGTVHIAVGNNLSYGGDNDVPLHLDGVIRDARVEADGKTVLEGNTLRV
ncbi:MAG: aminopeptidase [Candidatus Omnitrophica bacterium]|nr:aminopeptidase [Candidatus Omnitrophota bacterium]